jgi:hypothetical protein
MRRSGRGAAGAVVAAVLVLAVTGCSRSGTTDDPGTPLALVSGDGDGYDMAAELTGPVTVDAQGCVRLGTLLALWPEGSGWDRDADGLRLPGGALVARGASVSGGGGEVPGSIARARLADGQPLDRCDWVGTVAMFNPGSDVVAATP